MNYFPPSAIEEEIVDKVQNSYMLKSSIHSLWGGGVRDSLQGTMGVGGGEIANKIRKTAHF